MKVNVWQIVIDHLDTLRNDRSKRVSLVDILIFFGIPIIFGSIVYMECIKSSKGFYNVSVTFFGIFVALLLNFQVAAFGIYNRKWSQTEDEKLSAIQIQDLEIRRRLLLEVNANISYLILMATVSILIFLFFYALGKTGRAATAFSWALYVHFILTLLMVVKRSHILFRREYDEI